jgi:hypothetical protein
MKVNGGWVGEGFERAGGTPETAIAARLDRLRWKKVGQEPANRHDKRQSGAVREETGSPT